MTEIKKSKEWEVPKAGRLGRLEAIKPHLLESLEAGRQERQT